MVVSEAFPEAAVIVIWYMPAGVPVAGFSAGLEYPGELPQAAIADATSRSSTTRNCGTYRRTGALTAQSPNQIDAMRKATAHNSSTRGQAMRGRSGTIRAVCAIVAMESVTFVLLVPAGSEDGENDAVEFGGTPDALKFTVPPNEPFAGATASMKLAGCPAETVELEAGAVTAKSATAKASAEVMPPPGDGLFTVIFSVAPGVITFVGRTAVSDVALTSVVASDTLPVCTTELELKFAPVIFKVTGPLPGATLVGERLVMTGTGLFTVNDIGTEGAPFEFFTTTRIVPARATAVWGMYACNTVGVLLLNAAETGAEPNITVEEEENPVPIMVSVNPDGGTAPAVTLAGLSDPTVDCVFAGSTVKFTADDVPPLEKLTPNAGLERVTAIVPNVAMEEAATVVVSCEELTNVKGCTTPLKSSVAPCTKFAPLIVSRKGCDPVTTLGGLIDETVGDA